MSIKSLTVAVSTLVLSTSVNAAIINITPDNVSRIIGGGFSDTHFNDVFSTHSSSAQKSLLLTSNATILSALQNALGPASNYIINSATLTIGSATDDYASTGDKKVHTVLTSWNPDNVTWAKADVANNKNWNTSGLESGIDYTAAAADMGVVAGNGYQTQWNGLGSTVQSWLDGSASNYGLLFADVGSFSDAEFTNVANVQWTINAQVVPVPAAAWLFGSGIVSLIGIARRKRA